MYRSYPPERTLMGFAALPFIKATLMDYVVCPFVTRYIDESYCNTVSNALTAMQIAVTTTSVIDAVNSEPVQKIALTALKNSFQFILPAALTHYVINSFIHEETPPLGLFATSIAKTSFEMTIAQYMASSTFPNYNPVISGLICSTNIAYAINTMFYMSKTLTMDEELFTPELMDHAHHYALGYATARPLYQMSKILDEADYHNAASLICFCAPIARGYIIGLYNTGSITVPGKDISILKNIADGAFTASASIARNYLDELKSSTEEDLSLVAEMLSHIVNEDLLTYLGSGNLISLTLISAELTHQGVKYLVSKEETLTPEEQPIPIIETSGNIVNPTSGE